MDRVFIIIAGIATIIFFVLSFLIVLSSRRRRRSALERFHYRPYRQLMTGHQKRCFQLLNDLFGQRFYIIPDVDLSALLNHKIGRQNRQEAYDVIAGKTVDFVFCNKRTLRPICAVKLGPTNYILTNGKMDDDPEDLKKFFQRAHLPLVYIAKSTKINRQTIIEEFSRVIYESSLES